MTKTPSAYAEERIMSQTRHQNTTRPPNPPVSSLLFSTSAPALKVPRKTVPNDPAPSGPPLTLTLMSLNSTPSSSATTTTHRYTTYKQSEGKAYTRYTTYKQSEGKARTRYTTYEQSEGKARNRVLLQSTYELSEGGARDETLTLDTRLERSGGVACENWGCQREEGGVNDLLSPGVRRSTFGALSLAARFSSQ